MAIVKMRFIVAIPMKKIYTSHRYLYPCLYYVCIYFDDGC